MQEFILFILYKVWFDLEYELSGRVSSGKKYFQDEYCKLSQRVMVKLKYYRKYTIGHIRLTYKAGSTDRDGEVFKLH